VWHAVRQVANVVFATCAVLAVLVVGGAGFRALPALGRVLDPGHGAWTSAAGGELPRSHTLRLPGLVSPVTITFSPQGIATVDAANEGDALLAEGYLHASFRLTQMDLARRLAEGKLAQLAGPSAVASDEFELRLGLLRTAQQEWAEMPKNSIPALMLESYAKGVNDYLKQLRKDQDWPAAFSLAGVYPANWTPVDSLAIQGDLTQVLDYTTTPLDYALLARSLGRKKTMAFFPILPVNGQAPYDPGPYLAAGIAPVLTSMTAASSRTDAKVSRSEGSAAGDRRIRVPSAGVAKAAAAMLAVTGSLPAGQVHGYPDSNAWAANGPKVSGGGAMLAGDPHLPQTLPSIWYQVAIAAPDYDVTGVSVPGLPGIVIGHNKHIAWSMTDTQNQATLFYAEKTSPAHQGEYFWRGQWRKMRYYHYVIPVRGQRSRRLTVAVTVHGPVMTQAGQTVSVDWMGNVPTPDVDVLQQISTAHDFSQFRAALANWRAPAQNFVYADDRGNIGAISAGYYPVTKHGTAWLPMPGTGADDVAGVIPYRAVPQVYDPPGHVIATANQRPVTGTYPYYIGTTANFFDPGYRAAREYKYLDARSNMTVASFAGLQSSQIDELAGQVLPRMITMLRHAKLTAMEENALTELRSWNYSMDQNSAGAAIWWTVWSDYLSATFQPWWEAARVPVKLDRDGLSVSTGQFSLDADLENWTLHDRSNPAFTPPGASRETAATVLLGAFSTAVSDLHGQLGGMPGTWEWGKLHKRLFPSLTAARGLSYGPRASGGDSWTVDAAYGLPDSSAGPSWRMIVRWSGASGRGRGSAVGIYPGGQSENPASPWYENLVADWWDNKYLPMPAPGGSGALAAGSVRWELEP
jgi:penicillin amidase